MYLQRASSGSDQDEEEESQLYWVQAKCWKCDELIVRSGKWLNSNVINAAMTLVQQHFSEINSLQETTRAVSKISGLRSQSDGSSQVPTSTTYSTGLREH